MKITNLKNVTAILLISVFFAGCKDDQWARIDSLSSDGDEFYCNQKVKLWMCVESNSLVDVGYQWGCEDGTLTQPQGLNEMTWKAPNIAGTYRVWCTTSIDGKKETRYHDMLVTGYFFEKFEKSTYAFSNQSNTTLSRNTETVGGVSNSYLTARCNITTASNRYITYSFGDSDLKVPFGSVIKTGWVSNFPADTVRVGTSTFPNIIRYQILGSRDPESVDAPYIAEVRFDWYPVGNAKGLPVDTDSGLPFNGTVSWQRNIGGSTLWYNVRVNSPALNFAQGEYKNMAVNIAEDYTVSVYVAGTKVMETDEMKLWKQTNMPNDDMHIATWRFTFPNGNGANNPPYIYFDDAYAYNDGTIAK